MTRSVASLVSAIDGRLEVLRGDIARLEAARSALLRSEGVASGAGRSVLRRTRARGGVTRADQVIALVEAQPGISASELVVAMGTAPSYLYRVLTRLERAGRVKREGRGWRLSA